MIDVATMDIDKILKYLPHRYPFLLVDRVLECKPGETIRALKNVTYNEPYFPGHFPHRPVMPGVMIIEALAQTAGALIVHSMALKEPPLVFFMGIDKARFRKPVVPGDVLRLSVKAIQHRGPVWKFEGKAYVGETMCCEGEFSAMIRTDSPG